MSMNDPIADMLTRIRNAQMTDKKSVRMPMSKVKKAIADVMESEGYINGSEVHENDGKPELEVFLKYFKGRPVIAELKRISRPGLRQFKAKDELPRVQGGLGVAIISTSSGVVSEAQARKMGQGGEVLCTIA